MRCVAAGQHICQMSPEFVERRLQVHVAYWDAEQGAALPALLGEVSSTPAIRAVLSASGRQRTFDYQGVREPEELARFARAAAARQLAIVSLPSILNRQCVGGRRAHA